MDATCEKMTDIVNIYHHRLNVEYWEKLWLIYTAAREDEDSDGRVAQVGERWLNEYENVWLIEE